MKSKKILVLLLGIIILTGCVTTSVDKVEGSDIIPSKNNQTDKNENKENLTLDNLKELVSTKGKNLTWSDFEKYSSTDVGFGLYVLLYKINDDYNLYIGGANTKEEPLYIKLVSIKDENKFIDVRESSIDEFLNTK